MESVVPQAWVAADQLMEHELVVVPGETRYLNRVGLREV